MCGIAGGFNLNDAERSKLLLTLLSRGPDSSGVYVAEKSRLCLLHTRLSIIGSDIHSRQPMKSVDKRYVLSFNGEIYNYQFLRSSLEEKYHINFASQSDTEVLLYGLIHVGFSFLKLIKGFFAFALLDELTSSIYLARDQFGIKPLYLSEDEKSLTFSSSMSYFTALNSNKYSKDGLQEFITFGSTYSNKTYLQNVSELPPGKVFVFSSQDHRVKEKYDYSLSNELLQRMESIYEPSLEGISYALDRALSYSLSSDVPISIFLSGGLDSAAIASSASFVNSRITDTFTLTSSLLSYDDEVERARMLSNFYGIRHNVICVDDFNIKRLFDSFIAKSDLPSADGFNTFLISNYVSSSYKVALSGSGGDEIFNGYPFIDKIVNCSHLLLSSYGKNIANSYFSSPLVNRFLNKIAYRLISRSHHHLLLRRIRYDQYPPTLAHLADDIKDLHSQSTLVNSLFQELSGYLRFVLLRDIDRNSMSSSLELRPPLLDIDLIASVYKFMVANQNRRTFADKQILSTIIRKRYPLYSETKKLGFELPYQFWLNNDLNDCFKDCLSAPSFLLNYFPKRIISALMDRAHSKTAQKCDWGLFVLLTWFKRHHTI